MQYDETCLEYFLAHQEQLLPEPVEETIEEATPEEDVLTRHIYHYDLKSDQIEMMAA